MNENAPDIMWTLARTRYQGNMTGLTALEVQVTLMHQGEPDSGKLSWCDQKLADPSWHRDPPKSPSLRVIGAALRELYKSYPVRFLEASGVRRSRTTERKGKGGRLEVAYRLVEDTVVSWPCTALIIRLVLAGIETEQPVRYGVLCAAAKKALARYHLPEPHPALPNVDGSKLHSIESDIDFLVQTHYLIVKRGSQVLPYVVAAKYEHDDRVHTTDRSQKEDAYLRKLKQKPFFPRE